MISPNSFSISARRFLPLVADHRRIERFGEDPASPRNPPGPVAERESAGTTAGRENLVMIVDDDTDCRETLQLLLETHGVRSVSAKNGLEALELLRSGVAPSLILLDNWMPVMTGEQFLFIRKTDPGIAAIPVLMVSAWDYFRGDGSDLDVHGFVKKPFDAEALLHLVHRFCPS